MVLKMMLTKPKIDQDFLGEKPYFMDFLEIHVYFFFLRPLRVNGEVFRTVIIDIFHPQLLIGFVSFYILWMENHFICTCAEIKSGSF